MCLMVTNVIQIWTELDFLLFVLTVSLVLVLLQALFCQLGGTIDSLDF